MDKPSSRVSFYCPTIDLSYLFFGGREDTGKVSAGIVLACHLLSNPSLERTSGVERPIDELAKELTSIVQRIGNNTEDDQEGEGHRHLLPQVSLRFLLARLWIHHRSFVTKQKRRRVGEERSV